MSLRVATFNVENLLQRFDFAEWRKRNRNSSDKRIREQMRLYAHEDDARQMTALAIGDCRADVVCLQEVEDLAVLYEFEEDYLEPLTGLRYPQKVWKQGNDGRGIDVALMAREKTADGKPIELLGSKSHRKLSFEELGLHDGRLADMGIEPGSRIFRRDCLEVDLRVGGKRLTLFICHFKSMGGGRDGLTGREFTMPVRAAEAKATRMIVERRFGRGRAARMRWLICGDLNDYTERLVISGSNRSGHAFDLEQEQSSGVAPLLDDGFSTDLVKRRAGQDRWTLFHAAGEAQDAREPDIRPLRHLVQLDYLLASPSLAGNNLKAVPDILRAGQPLRTVFPPDQLVERYPRTGWDRPKASDHCPVAVTLKMV